MFSGINFDLNTISFYFWFVLLGLLTVIFSIIHNQDYFFAGLAIGLYGMIAHVIDLLFDRIAARNINTQLTPENFHLVKPMINFFRFGIQLLIIIGLVYTMNLKYHFFATPENQITKSLSIPANTKCCPDSIIRCE